MADASAAPRAGTAHDMETIVRIGMLPGAPTSPALREGPNQIGYVEGRNLVIGPGKQPLILHQRHGL